MEARRQGSHGVAVAHPGLELVGQAVEQRAGSVVHQQAGVPKLLLVEPLDLAAELVREQLQAIADAQDRQLAREDAGIAARRVLVVDAAGAAGQDDALGIAEPDLLPGRIVGQ